MSDTGAAVGGAPAEATAPEGASAPAGVEGSGPAEATPSAPPEYLDADQYAGHHVRLKVDGEELEVPLSEALQGYSRQQDYTRKTQALADQQREAQFAITLQRALENNPQATLRLLQEQYGAEVGQPAAAEDDDSWLDDPVEARMREYDQRLQQAESFRAEQELQTALRVLQNQFGEDFNANEVVSRAVQQGRMDLANVYKEIACDRLFAQQQAQAEVQRRQQAEEQQRIAAKAGVTAHGGSSSNSGPEPEPGNASSISEAYYQAKSRLGIT